MDKEIKLGSQGSDSIFNYLSYTLVNGSDTTADVLIHCQNGVIPTHRLVLASVSNMLLSIFKQDTWDEQIVLVLRDYSVDQVCSYFKDFYNNGFKNKNSFELGNILGVQEGFYVKHEDLEKVSVLNSKGNKEDKHELSYENIIDLATVKFKEEINYEEEEDEANLSDNKLAEDFDQDYFNEDSYASENDLKEVKKKKKKRKKINSTDCEPKKNESEARQYFFSDEENVKNCICKMCSASITNTIHRMRTHLMYKHTEIFITLKPAIKKQRKVSSSLAHQKKYGQYITEIPNNPAKKRCNICNKIYSSANINRHIVYKHKIYKDGEGPKQVLCSFCGKVFRDKWHRDEHEDVKHKNLHRHICSFCGESFKYPKQLDEHMQQHSESADTSLFPFICFKCGKKYMKKESLKAHNCEGTEGSFQCAECGLAFNLKQTLQLHEKTCYLFSHCRDAIRTLTCTKCNIKFSSYRNMKQHCLQSTTCTLLESKPYQCMECRKYFTTEKRLTIHMRVHTGETPYSCDICHKKFKFNFKLTTHKCLQGH